GFAKTLREIIEIDGRVGERDFHGEAALEDSRVDSKRCLGPSRTGIFARHDKRTSVERVRPIGNLNFAGARKAAELEHGDAGLRILAKIDKDCVGLERPRDDFVGRFGVVRVPDGTRGGGSCLLSNLAGKDRHAMSQFGEQHATGQSGDPSADDGDLFRHPECCSGGHSKTRKGDFPRARRSFAEGADRPRRFGNRRSLEERVQKTDRSYKIQHVKIFAAMAVLVGTGFFCAAQPIVSDSHFATIDGAKVHYTNYGKGDMALVFVHGWSCDETVWQEQAPVLAEKMRVITIDLPGHGQSDKPHIAYTMDFHARAIDAVLRDATVSSVILIGHSNGTPVIRRFYRQFPAKVRGLVIVEGGLRPFVDAANMEKFIAPLRGENYEAEAGRFIDGMTKPIKDATLRERIKALMLRTPQYVAVSEFEGTADPALWKPDKIDIPVLMILAKQPVWTAEYEQFARSLVPNLDYQVWENVSHFVMMEKPREFNQALTAFLEKNKLLPNRS
ncbi:MAG: hypothetical protein QOE73_1202, partial [Verrucomicrobiota bacterium]